MDCFGHEKMVPFGHGRRHGHGMDYGIPWDGYEFNHI